MLGLVRPIDPKYNHGEFYVDSEAEISKLPTTTNYGQDNLSTIAPVAAGSTAYTNDGNLSVFTLNGTTGLWTKVQ